MRVLTTLLVLALTFSAADLDAERGALTVFVLPSESAVSTGFEHDALPMARALAEEMGIAFEVRDARAGAPDDVVIVPLLVYRNFRGRSVYEGRTTTPQRLRNFLRTARVAPHGAEPLVFADVPAWFSGRARVAAPLKVTPLTGTRPEDLADSEFDVEVRAALAQGFDAFAFVDRIELRRSDRRFYFDVHSYRESDGRLFVTFEVYSQFHCKEPIASRLTEPLEGTWAERADLYAEVGRALEAAALAVIAAHAGGDGFEPLSDDVLAMSWDELGLALPPAPERPAPSFSPSDLPTAWRLRAARPDDPPRLSFHFLSPLDGMRGEVGHVEGELSLGDGRGFANATGWVEALVATVSMGDEGLDHWIQGEPRLNGEEHPRARFELASFEVDSDELQFGRLTTGVASGSFRMKGLEVPLQMRLQLEVVVDDAGEPLLVAQGAFELPILEPFGLEGPGGPQRANTTLAFDVDFALEPAAK